MKQSHKPGRMHARPPDAGHANMPPGVLQPPPRVNNAAMQPGYGQPPAPPVPALPPYPQNGPIPPSREHGGAHGQHGITPTVLLQQEAEGDDMILYRSQRFFVRTANRPDQRKNPLRKRTGNTSLLGASFVSQIRWLSSEKQRITEAETRILLGWRPSIQCR